MNLRPFYFIIYSLFVLAATFLLVPEILNYLIGKNDLFIIENFVKGYATISKLVMLVLFILNLANIFYFSKSKNGRYFKISLSLIMLLFVFFKYIDYSKFYLEKKISDNRFNAYKIRFDLVENNRFIAYKYFQDKVNRKEMSSLQKLVRVLASDFEKNKIQLDEELGFKTGQLNHAVYLMGFVSQVWAYGNDKAPAESGCVFNNEIDRSGFSGKKFSDYIDSKIGCCTDYAYLLKALLDVFKISNKLVLIKGHIFNEINFGIENYVLDANINVVYTLSWKEIIETNKPFEVFSFSHVGMDKDTPYFRSIIGNFKQKMYWLVNTRYSYFEYKDQIPEPYASLLKDL